MSKSRTQKLRDCKRRIAYRLRERHWQEQARPMFAASNIHYELTAKDRGLGEGGIGAMHLLARRVGLVERIDQELHLLKRHLPYHESDHVLNMAYNILCGGTCLDDLELRRNDEVYRDALGAQRIPDPTTEGDFCRRFTAADVETLMEVINQTRVSVWHRQGKAFFGEAVIDVDGHIAETGGECKQGLGMSYDGRWSYHPLIVSLANTREPLYVVNRSDQENVIEQLKNGVHALRMPVGDLVSNGAYMVMASLAWTLKAWFALLLPDKGRWKDKHQREKQSVLAMEFKKFVNAFVRVPAQLIRTGRRLVFKLLSWNPWQEVFLRGVDVLRKPLRC